MAALCLEEEEHLLGVLLALGRHEHGLSPLLFMMVDLFNHLDVLLGAHEEICDQLPSTVEEGYYTSQDSQELE